MKKTTTDTYTQTVTDSGNILIANFSGQKTNGGVNNVSIGINTIESYQANKDIVVAAFDAFIVSMQTDGTRDVPQVSNEDKAVAEPVADPVDTTVNGSTTTDTAATLSSDSTTTTGGS